MHALQGFIGIFVLVGVAWLLSEHRKAFSWRLLIAGLVTQFVLAVLLLKIPVFNQFFVFLNDVLLSLEIATRAGSAFVFGYLAGGDLPFDEKSPGSSFILAFRALPLVLVVSALSSLLFYWGVLPWLVKGFSRVLQITMGIGGALGVAAGANIFVGMIEAPLLVRPYLLKMSRGELFALMSVGMATIAGTVLVLYASILTPVIPGAVGHILTASIISVPAAIMIALIMVPMTGEHTEGEFTKSETMTGSMDAITQGTLQGVTLLLNIIAMLLVLVALVSLLNIFFGVFPDIDGEPVTLQRLLGYVMVPFVWLIGIPYSEAFTAGTLMGTKTVLNEFIAYVELSKLPSGSLSERSQLIMVYAMCGFANFGSLGIMLGGLGTMMPQRRSEIVALGMKSIVAGTIATMMTGSIVGILN